MEEKVTKTKKEVNRVEKYKDFNKFKPNLIFTHTFIDANGESIQEEFECKSYLTIENQLDIISGCFDVYKFGFPLRSEDGKIKEYFLDDITGVDTNLIMADYNFNLALLNTVAEELIAILGYDGCVSHGYVNLLLQNVSGAQETKNLLYNIIKQDQSVDKAIERVMENLFEELYKTKESIVNVFKESLSGEDVQAAIAGLLKNPDLIKALPSLLKKL